VNIILVAADLGAAEWYVGGAEEEVKSRRTAVLQQRSERSELVLCFRLSLDRTDEIGADETGRRGQVVTEYRTTHRHCDPFTLSHLY